MEVKLDFQNLGQACLILFRKENNCDMRGLMKLEIEKEVGGGEQIIMGNKGSHWR